MTRITTRMLLIPLCCIATTACEPARPFDRDDAPAADPTPISVSSVIEQPSSYTGRQITLAGEIVDVFSPFHRARSPSAASSTSRMMYC